MKRIEFDQNGNVKDPRAEVKLGEEVHFISPVLSLELRFPKGSPFEGSMKKVPVPSGSKGARVTVIEEEFVYKVKPIHRSTIPKPGDARIIVRDSRALAAGDCEDIIRPDFTVTVANCDIFPEETKVENGDVVLFDGPKGTQIQFTPPAPFKRCGPTITLPRACVVFFHGPKTHEFSVVGCHVVGTAKIIVKDA